MKGGPLFTANPVCKIEGKGDDDCRLLRKGVMNAADNDKLHDFTLDEQLCWHGCCTALRKEEGAHERLVRFIL